LLVSKEADPLPLSQAEIIEVLSSCGLECDLALAERVQVYLRFLVKWNEKINLTAVLNPLDVMKVLLAESFCAAVLLDKPKGPILDIGSGAGFPGLAMAVYRPELELVLLEPRKKRAAFLAALRREMGLPGIAVWNRRIEDCFLSDFSVLPAVLTMRAVGRITEIVKAGVRFLQGDGRVLLFSSTQSAKSTMDSLKEIHWGPAQPIPWNNEHLILLGHVASECST
jgi:16S rRNA (guanine527-N7)-methyltransferase